MHAPHHPGIFELVGVEPIGDLLERSGDNLVELIACLERETSSPCIHRRPSLLSLLGARDRALRVSFCAAREANAKHLLNKHRGECEWMGIA
jgi:hypothetical protein